MVKVKMIKGRSYHGAVTTNRKNQFAECSEEVADSLIESGHFSLIGEVTDEDAMEDHEDVGSASAQEQLNGKSISRMNTEELVAFAEKIGVDISSCKNNEEKKALLKIASKAMTDDENDSELPFQIK